MTPQFNRTPWKNDPLSKQFSHERFFGSVAPQYLPATLGRPRREVEDQGNTTRCAAYAGAVNGGYMHNKRFHPDWLAIKIGQVQGYSVDLRGSDPNAAMRAQSNFGYLPWEASNIHLETNGPTESGNRFNYPSVLDATAYNYHNAGYVRVDGPYDTFDNIRNALFKAYDNKKKTGAVVQAFSGWYQNWSYTDIIPPAGVLVGYHSYDFIDYETINGIPYLVAQNSYRSFGNNGIHHFPREVVNAEFTQPGRTLKIPAPLTPEQIALAKEMSLYGRIQRQIILIWQTLTQLHN